MRFSILALGSRGDVQPFAALGRGLCDAGHQVRLSTFESFAPLVREYGLDFHPVKGDAEALVKAMVGAGANDTRNPILLMRAIRDSFGQIVADYLEAFTDPVFADSDVILNQLPGGLFGAEIAERYRIPQLLVAVIPMVPTRFYAPPLLTNRNFGAVLNRASYTLANVLLRQMFKDTVAQMRRRMELPRTPPPRERPVPVINGFSPRVVPPPPDWSSHVHTTSWWITPHADWTPPADLVEFIHAGDPPVFIGFGSMVTNDPAALTQTVINGVKMSGVRAILAKGWSNLGGDLPDNMFALDYAPYEWLFPQMAAVIHHGGSGTTGAALRSGVPSMVVSFLADQPFWGMRTAALGVGAASIPVKSLTPEKLASAIKMLTTDPTLKHKAAELGAALRSEDGISMAIESIRRSTR